MKQVSTREFQLHLKKHLSELPIVLTLYGKPVAKVLTLNELQKEDFPKKVLTEKVLTQPTQETTKVLTQNPEKNVLTDKPVLPQQTNTESVNTSVSEILPRCQAQPYCTLTSTGKQKVVSTDVSGNEVTKKLFLCDLHLKKASKVDW